MHLLLRLGILCSLLVNVAAGAWVVSRSHVPQSLPRTRVPSRRELMQQHRPCQSCGATGLAALLNPNQVETTAHANGDDMTSSNTTAVAWNQKLDQLLSSSLPPSNNRLSLAVDFLQRDLQPDGANGQAEAALDQAATRPPTPLSKSNWDALFTAIEEATIQETYEHEQNAQAIEAQSKSPSRSTEATSAAAATLFPITSTARNDMVHLYKVLADRGDLQLYGAVSTAQPPAVVAVTTPNQGLAVSYQVVSPAALESILDLPMSALTPRPTNTFLLAGTALALIEGLASVALDIPLNSFVLATLLLATLDRLFLNGAVLESCLQSLSPGIRDKIIRHEAGHLLAAYLLGCPVEGIVLSAWAALKDERFGARQVSAGTSFFDPDLSRQINTSRFANQNDNAAVATVTRDSIDRYSIIVMAGIAAEADFYGQADGGAGDEMALVAFLRRLTGSANKNRVAWNDPEQIRTQARWGALQAVLLLRQYKPAHDAIIDALQRGGRLGDCIFALERAAREHNLPTRATRQPVGYIVTDPSKGFEWTTAPPTQLLSDSSVVIETAPFDAAQAQLTLQDYKDKVKQQLETVQEKLKTLHQRNV
jgi:hypothetical protein